MARLGAFGYAFITVPSYSFHFCCSVHMIPLQSQIYTASILGHITYITQFFFALVKKPLMFIVIYHCLLFYLYISTYWCVYLQVLQQNSQS